MSTTVGNLKDLMARYMGPNKTASDLTIDGFDIGIFALNAARRKLERLVDLRYSEIQGALSISSSGGAISAITGLGTGATLKRVVDVELPIAAGDYMPIEYLTQKEWRDRVRRQIGRQAYSVTATIASLGIADVNPFAYQQGQTIFLAPAAQFTFPVAARVNVIRFLADYTANGDTDFLTQWAPEYLQWEGILEINKYFRRFGNKDTEVAIDEKEVGAFAQEAMQSLLAWNASLNGDTSTPPEG